MNEDINDTATEVKAEKPEPTMTWASVNEQERVGLRVSTEGRSITKPDGTREYEGAPVYLSDTVSDSGYQIGSKNGPFKDDEPYRAYRLFKRNEWGKVVYTPWIPTNDRDAERDAMWAYSLMLKTGKLPTVGK